MVVTDRAEDVIAFVKERVAHVQDFGSATALGVVDDTGALAAGVVYNDYTGGNLEMSVAAAFPNWCRPHVLAALFHYPFIQLGVRRVSMTARSDAAAKHVRRFAQHLGFKYEGTRKEFFPDGVGSVHFGMLKRDCRWLEA